MKQKRVPLRMCAGCGERFDKRALIRVVKSPDGEVSLDLTGKKAGRGAYVCRSLDCLKKARKARRFERAFSQQISDEVYDRMEEELAASDG
ncbi:MAG: YlxR family protein [Clostridiales bacterium]|nr:YlxR family protein [Clostridiales bacterium]